MATVQEACQQTTEICAAALAKCEPAGSVSWTSASIWIVVAVCVTIVLVAMAKYKYNPLTD